MPKPPAVERFKLSCEVEAADLGPTLANLTKMGLTNLGFELITDVRTFHKNAKPGKTKQQGKANPREFVADWIRHHAEVKAADLMNAFIAAGGLSRSAIYFSLNKLTENGVLKKISAGEYLRTDGKPAKATKAKKATKKNAKKTAKKKPSASTGRYAVSNGDFILRAARKRGGRFNTADMRSLFETDKRTPASVSPTLNTLATQKKIKRTGDGEYILLAKAAQIVNGAAHPES